MIFFSVNIHELFSSVATIKYGYGLPQRSILGHVLFSIYVLLGDIIQDPNTGFQCYADDTQT